MTRHLAQSNMTVLKTKAFTILHSEESILRQIRVAQSKLVLFSNEQLRHGMEQYLTDLGERVHVAIATAPNNRISCSFDYVIASECTQQAVVTDSVGGGTVFKMSDV
jgi:hypothetical protein